MPEKKGDKCDCRTSNRVIAVMAVLLVILVISMSMLIYNSSVREAEETRVSYEYAEFWILLFGLGLFLLGLIIFIPILPPLGIKGIIGGGIIMGIGLAIIYFGALINL